jgi:RND family efflux transporter MFP subunit
MTSCIRPLGYLVFVVLLLAGRVALAARHPKVDAEKSDDAAASEKSPQSDKESKTAAKPEKAKSGSGSEAAAEPATYTVKKGPFKIELSLKGGFEPEKTYPVSVRLKEWKVLEVRKAVPHGTHVKRGQTLVEFKLEEIDKLIADATTDRRLAELTLKQAEESLHFMEAATPIDLELAQRAKRNADQDLARYLKVERPMQEKGEAFMLKTANNMLEYEQAELRELEKMYKANDVVEETEEIILKRQRDMVERAKFSLEVAKMFHDTAVKFTIPREEESHKTEAVRQRLLLEKNQTSLPVALSQQKLELEKLKITEARAGERLKKIQEDRAAMTVTAPADGVVYYGQYVNGEWSGAAAASERLKAAGNVASGEVFMTVVKTRPLTLRATVAEKELEWVHPGLEGTVVPTGYPDRKLPATVAQVDGMPTAAGKFEAVLQLSRLGKEAAVLVPGMTGTAKLVPYLAKEALTVPASAVFSDEEHETRKFVYLVGKGGKAKKHCVTVGKKNDDRVEILKGLNAGDKILQEKPKDS